MTSGDERGVCVCWRGGGGGAEAWCASRGGSSDGRNAREEGRGGREVRRVRREGQEGMKAESGLREKAEASCIAELSARGSKYQG